MAQLLTDNDLRGVFSHGTQQIATYARLMREGILNPKPNVHIAKETPVSTIYDGDGGLGYFPAYESTLATIEKAKQQGIAIGQSRNHGHFGAAGIYTRLMLGHDLLGYVTSGHQLLLQEGDSLCHRRRWLTPFLYLARQQRTVDDLRTSARSMICMSVRPIVRRSHALPRQLSSARSGLGAICRSWGGFLAGVPLDTKRSTRTWEGANQGSLVIAFRIDLFISPERFKAEMDEYIQEIAKLAAD